MINGLSLTYNLFDGNELVSSEDNPFLEAPFTESEISLYVDGAPYPHLFLYFITKIFAFVKKDDGYGHVQ